MSAAVGGKRGRASLAPPTLQVGSVVSALAALSATITAATSSTIAPAGWMCDAARSQSPKQVYSMCHLLQKATLPRVGKATSGHNPLHVFPTENTETLDGTGFGDDLPVVVILAPPSRYD